MGSLAAGELPWLALIRTCAFRNIRQSGSWYRFPEYYRLAYEEGCAFEQPAKLLFGRPMMLTFTARYALEGFVADFQPFQIYDSDKFVTALPRLALLEFHAPTVVFRTAACQR